MDVASNAPRSIFKTAVFYLVMIGASLGIFLLIDHYAHQIFSVAPTPPDTAARVAGHKQINYILHILIAMAVVIVTAQILGGFFKFLHQPPVIGEVIGGILLGPSLLGRIAPELSAAVLPPSSAPFLSVIAQLGVILYMFLVGLELDLRVLRRSGHATIAISHASILVPFLLGTVLALFLYQPMAPAGVGFTRFSLFLGISMSITAFPVLARILTDRGIQKTNLGTVALTCAAVDDVTAWCLLALIVSLVQATWEGALVTLSLTAIYLLLMFFLVRPTVIRILPLLEKHDRVTESGMAVIVIAVLVSALATEVIGIHAIFGAFLLGAVIPDESRVASDLTERLQSIIRVLFLPAFFAFTGMRTQIGLLSSLTDWLLCGVIIIIATVGKFGGSFIAARLCGLKWRDAAGLGILMNTRGLVELIVLNIGLDLEILSPRLFTILVIMALVTTFMTTPILDLLVRHDPNPDSNDQKLHIL